MKTRWKPFSMSDDGTICTSYHLTDTCVQALVTKHYDGKWSVLIDYIDWEGRHTPSVRFKSLHFSSSLAAKRVAGRIIRLMHASGLT